jgi:VanZ family protein
VAVSRVLSAWAPVIAWAALIFALSSIPSLDSGLGFWDLLLRKAAHVAEYAVLGLLLARALVRDAAAVAAGIAYAATDEIHQHFVPGRNGAPLDLLFDAFGVVVGVLAFRRASK